MSDKANLIAKLKAEYAHIYSVSDSKGTEYFFRALSLAEVRTVEEFVERKLKNAFEIENFCLENCLLYPEFDDLDDIPPGVAKQVGDEILSVSGVTNAEFIIEALEHTRNKLVGDIFLDMKSYIISAMPSYKDSDLDNFTLLEIIEKLVLSETILTLQARMAGMEGDVRLTFETVGEEAEEAPVEQESRQKPQPKPKPKPKPKEPLPDKEELIRRINSKTTDNRAILPRKDEFEGFDPETLERMSGVAALDDPLARKLHGK